MQILKNNPQSKADFLHFNHILIVFKSTVLVAKLQKYCLCQANFQLVCLNIEYLWDPSEVHTQTHGTPLLCTENKYIFIFSSL